MGDRFRSDPAGILRAGHIDRDLRARGHPLHAALRVVHGNDPFERTALVPQMDDPLVGAVGPSDDRVLAVGEAHSHPDLRDDIAAAVVLGLRHLRADNLLHAILSVAYAHAEDRGSEHGACESHDNDGVLHDGLLSQLMWGTFLRLRDGSICLREHVESFLLRSPAHQLPVSKKKARFVLKY
jgi:hypothetical protein